MNASDNGAKKMRLHPSWPLGPGWAIPCPQDYIDVRGHILPPPDVTTTNLYLLFVYSKDQTNNITWMYTPECPNFDLQLECHRNLPLLSVTAPLEWDDQMLLVLVLFQQTSKASETIYQCSRKAYDFCEADNKYVLPQFEAKWHKSRYFSVSNAWNSISGLLIQCLRIIYLSWFHFYLGNCQHLTADKKFLCSLKLAFGAVNAEMRRVISLLIRAVYICQYVLEYT